MIGIHRLARLTPPDWISLAVAYWWLLKACWQMRRLRGRQWFEGPSVQPDPLPGSAHELDSGRIEQQARFINLASRYPYRWASCLQRSLALRQWLAREGVLADLRIGVQWDDRGKLRGHAWLEYGGEVLNDRLHWVGRFARLQRVGSGELAGQVSDQPEGEPR